MVRARLFGLRHGREAVSSAFAAGAAMQSAPSPQFLLGVALPRNCAGCAFAA